MQTTTFTYLAFLAAVTFLHWSLRGTRPRTLLLLASSWIFYAWWDVRFLPVLLVTSLVDWAVGLKVGAVPRGWPRTLLVAVSCAGNLGLLALFKYFDFGAGLAAAAAEAVGLSLHPPQLDLPLAVGLSFYTFQSLSYVIDVARGEREPERDLPTFMTYVSFFPLLAAGPIERAAHLLPQIRKERTFDAEEGADGCREILSGLFLKLALADNLAIHVDAVYGSAAPSGPAIALATVAFAFQIYWDFAGYTAIARGSARLLGVELVRNFERPYFAASLRDFWRRWHISLSTWFRDYVYRPLGGSRGGRARTAANLIATFVLSGLWHGAALHFVAWGAFHGIALAAERGLARSAAPPPSRLRLALRQARTFAIVCAGWILFRASSFPDAVAKFYRIAADAARVDLIVEALAGAWWIPVVIAGGCTVEWLSRPHPHPLAVHRWPIPLRWTLYTLLFWSALWLAPWEGRAFVYFQF